MDIISELQKFGFSKVEAEVYMEVLNVPMSNGTQISKKTDISRSAIYNALERLCEKEKLYGKRADGNNFKIERRMAE